MSADVLTLRARIAFPGFDLDVAEELHLGGVTAVFGPSGSGKSTLLRLIAGFERPGAGLIALGGTTWFDDRSGIDVPAHERPVGYMFQDGRLFPHLSVRGNLEYADRRSRARRARYTLSDTVEVFGLGELLQRRVGTLSGGERQRVALARTLLTRPDLLLLDEPLAGLDRARKHEILPYLEQLQRHFGTHVVYVSHDLDEVGRLAEHVIVLARGRARARGPAAEVIGSLDPGPATGDFEVSSLLHGVVAGHDLRLHLTRIDVGEDTVTVPADLRLRPGETARLRVLARDVALATRRPDGISIRNVLPGTVAAVACDDASAHADVTVELRSGRLRATLTRAAVEALELTTGKPVFALVKSMSFEDRLR